MIEAAHDIITIMAIGVGTYLALGLIEDRWRAYRQRSESASSETPAVPAKRRRKKSPPRGSSGAPAMPAGVLMAANSRDRDHDNHLSL